MFGSHNVTHADKGTASSALTSHPMTVSLGMKDDEAVELCCAARAGWTAPRSSVNAMRCMKCSQMMLLLRHINAPCSDAPISYPV